MLSRSCIYGLQAVLFLASQKAEGYVPIHRVSESLGFSHAFLTKVLQVLTQAGLHRSLRGPNGGVALARPASEITLVEIVEAIDGPALFEACILGLPRCGEDQPCLLHERWAPVRGDIQALFARTSVQEMVTREEARLYSLGTKDA